MALTKIRQANKKAARELKRKAVRAHAAGISLDRRIRKRRARKMLAQGRKEWRAKRRAEREYVKGLEAEVQNES